MENINESKNLLQITRVEDGTAVELHVSGAEEMAALCEGMASVAEQNPMIMMGLLLALKRNVSESPEEKEERHKGMVEMPDFNKCLDNNTPNNN